MPHSLFLAQNHIRTVCTREQFAAESCPAGSIYGRRSPTPSLFDEPLRGNVYLRSSVEQPARPGRRPAQRRRCGSSSRARIGPGKTRRHQHLLRQPARRPDRPLHDDAERRPPRPAAELLQHLQQPAAGHRQAPSARTTSAPASPPSCAASARRRRRRELSAEDTGDEAPGRNRGSGGASSPATAVAEAEIAQKGNLRVSVDGKLAPKRLPRTRVAPIAVSVGGRITTTDATLPPQLKTLRIELNRHGRLDYAGLPSCVYERIQPGSSSRALSSCRSALVGRGSFTANITLAGQEPYPTSGRLLVFNGVRRRQAGPLRPHLLRQALRHLLRDRLRRSKDWARAPTAPRSTLPCPRRWTPGAASPASR